MNHRCTLHRWFYAQEPTREVSGFILRGVEEQVHKGTWSPALLGPLLHITKINRNQETTVRSIKMRLRCIKIHILSKYLRRVREVMEDG
jgi:hypothetical protein